jgi:two-component system LytT family response regulator
VIRTVLVDDENNSIRVLQKLLQEYCPNVTVIGTADGVETGADLILSTRPDLVFLDIEMAQGNAFDLLNQLQPLSFQVIFVTAFDNYALRAFKYSAVDYLLKPVNIRDLCTAVERVSDRFEEKNVLGRMATLLQNLSGVQQLDQKVAIPTLNGFLFVTLREIIRLEAKGGYTIIYLTNKEEIMATRSIKEYEDLLPEVFFCRVHSSHIINMHKIRKYQKGRGGYVTMEDNSTIEVASRRRDEFMQRLLK